MLKLWTYDIETFTNYSLFIFKQHKTENLKTFELWEDKNNISEMLKFVKSEFIKNKNILVGYNNSDFDNYVLAYSFLPDLKANDIYKFVQKIITENNKKNIIDELRKNKLSSLIYKLNSCDLYKLNGYNNKNKQTSLKWLMATMQMPLIQDMPYDHTHKITTNEEIKVIKDYCLNDIKATEHLLVKSKNAILYRWDLQHKFGIEKNLLSHSETDLGKELLLYFLSDFDKNKKQFILAKALSEKSSFIKENLKGKDVMIENISLKNTAMQQTFENISLTEDSEEKDELFQYDNHDLTIYYGKGGAHASAKPSVYLSDNEYVIYSFDVTSYYPNVTITNKLYPRSLGANFYNRYEWFYNERKNIPKSNPLNLMYKNILNSAIGLSNDKYGSYLFDPKFFYSVTINGQLFLTELYEMLHESIPNIKCLMFNTDGCEYLVPKQYETMFIKVLKTWEKQRDLPLEITTYSKLVLADVNNYIAFKTPKLITPSEYKDVPHLSNIDYTNPPVKWIENTGNDYYLHEAKIKGRFVFSELELHKNPSSLIVPKSIYNYYAFNYPIVSSVMRNNNIYDYLFYNKRNKKMLFYYITPNNLQYFLRDKVIRFYITKMGEGGVIIKTNKENNEYNVRLTAGALGNELINNMKDIDKITKVFIKKINKNYYIQKAKEEITKISPIITQSLLDL